MKIISATIVLFITTFIKAQNTIQYNCSIYTGKNMMLLYESLQLYPDGTFAQTSEYDLYLHQFGRYTKNNDTLILSLYNKAAFIVGSDYKNITQVVDSISQTTAPDELKKYIIKNDRLYILKPGGNILNRITDNSVPKAFGWLLGNRHKYYYRKEPVTPFNDLRLLNLLNAFYKKPLHKYLLFTHMFYGLKFRR